MDLGKDINFRSEALSVQITSREKSKFIGKLKIDQLQSGYVSRMGCGFFIHVMQGLTCLALLIVNWISLHVLTSFQLALDSKPFGSISQNIDVWMFFSLFLRNIISSSTVADTKIGQPFSEHNFIGVYHCFILFAFSLQRNGKTKSLIGTVFTHV